MVRARSNLKLSHFIFNLQSTQTKLLLGPEFGGSRSLFSPLGGSVAILTTAHVTAHHLLVMKAKNQKRGYEVTRSVSGQNGGECGQLKFIKRQNIG